MYGSGLGVTMGAHRLWSHRAFKAKTGLKIFLLWLHTLAGQVIRNSIQYINIGSVLLRRFFPIFAHRIVSMCGFAIIANIISIPIPMLIHITQTEDSSSAT